MPFDFFTAIGQYLPVVTVFDFSALATCYAEPDAQVRPTAILRQKGEIGYKQEFIVRIVARFFFGWRYTYERSAVSVSNSKPNQIIHEATNDQDIRRCWPVFHELRPHLTEVEFVRRWHAQRKEGYDIVFIEIGGDVVAAAGFRVMNTMAWGKILYLDDLITLRAQQGQGWGSALLVWLQELARAQDCEAIHLDTGYHRQAAHKAYLRHGFDLNCHHLAWKVA